MAETIHQKVRDAYEAIAYVGRPFHETHPNRLLAVAQLHGVAPPKWETISVLEIGCGDGAPPVLIPLGDFVRHELGRTPSQIDRQDLSREVVVSANLDDLPLGTAAQLGDIA
mgnify:CR=1 FL=1